MVEVQIRSDSRYPVDRKRVKRLVGRVLTTLGMTSDVTVSLAVVGRRQMQTLNLSFHEEDRVTDVLSFPYIDPQSSRDQGMFRTPPKVAQILGDIVVCYPVAVEEARDRKLLVDDQIDFLVEHGLNHLLGKHHD